MTGEPANPTPVPPAAIRQIARAAGTVMAAYVLTQLLGLLRGFLIFRIFGTTADLDSFNAANRVTEVLFNLMAGGALGSAFIPTFTGLLAREQRQAAWKLASAIANLLMLVLTTLAGAAFLLAPLIVRHGLFVLAPAQVPSQEDLTTLLLRMMLPTVVIFGLSGLSMGVLNAHQKFWLPAIAPAMYSLGQIAGVLLLPAEMGITRLALGAIVGASLHLLVQSPHLFRLKGRYIPTLGLRMGEVHEVAHLMGPRILGVAVVQVNFIVNVMIGLSLPEGSVSALTLAFTWMLMPQAAIAQSVAVAAMPTFSAQATLGKFAELRSSLAASLRGVLLFAIPAATGLILLRNPLISIYEGGEFTARSTELVTWALLWYTAGLVFHCLLEVVVRAFYSLHDTRTPVMATIGAMALNVVFSLTFPGWFTHMGWLPLGGLALANSLATFLEIIILIPLLSRRLSGLEGLRVWSAAANGLLASLGMGLALLVLIRLTTALPSWLVVVLGVGAGSTVYASSLALLRTQEVFTVWRSVRNKLRL